MTLHRAAPSGTITFPRPHPLLLLQLSRPVADALMMAVWRLGTPMALLHHSDQGSRYTSEHFQK